MQPHVLNWTNPTADTNGGVYAQSDNAGYQVSVDGKPAVTVPLVWGTSFDLSTLNILDGLPPGNHTATLALVSKQGVVGTPASVSFPIYAVPGAPGNLSIT